MAKSNVGINFKTLVILVVSVLIFIAVDWTGREIIAPGLVYIGYASSINSEKLNNPYVALPAAIFLFGFYWVIVLWVYNAIFGRKSSNLYSHGSAKFADKKILNIFKTEDGVILGKDKGKFIRYSGPSHLLTVAPTRAGKGVSAIIPNLLMARRPIICVDPKGENTRISSKRRASFGPVHVVDPFAISGERTSRFNPLSSLSTESDDLVENAMVLAEAIVFDPPDQVREAHWNEAARSLISGILLYVVTHERPENRNLGRLRDYLTLAPNQFQAFLVEMSGTDAGHGVIRKAANAFLGKDGKEASGVLSTAQRHTQFLDAPRISKSLSETDFDLFDILKKNGTIFLVLPPDKLETYNRWMRLILTQITRQLISATDRPEKSVLFVMDEFAALGRMEIMEKAVAIVAGYGIQLWPIVQDLSQLRSIYGSRADTFLSNAGVFQAFNVRDLETAQLVSKMLGETTIAFETFSESRNSEGDITHSESVNVTGRALLNPDEVIALRPDWQLLFIQQAPPILAEKVVYYKDKEFQGLYGAR